MRTTFAARAALLASGALLAVAARADEGMWLLNQPPVKQLQDKVKRYCFVRPRKVRLPAIAGQLERPLRAQTAQGPRVTVVRSDIVPAGSCISFELHVLRGG